MMMRSPITPERLTTALRLALPDCAVELSNPYVGVYHAEDVHGGVVRCKVFRGFNDVEIDWICDRADRDLARRVFQVLDDLEDGDSDAG